MFKSGCARVLQARVLQELPDGTRRQDGSIIASTLEQLKLSDAYTFAYADAQTNVNVVVEWTKALALLRKPSFVGVADSTFMKDAQARMKHMLQISVAPDPASSAENT